MLLSNSDTKELDKTCELLAGIFKQNGWAWASVGVPTAEDILDQIVRYIGELNSGESDWIQSGRIRVSKCFWDEGDDDYTFEVFLDVGAFFGTEYEDDE